MVGHAGDQLHGPVRGMRQVYVKHLPEQGFRIKFRLFAVGIEFDRHGIAQDTGRGNTYLHTLVAIRHFRKDRLPEALVGHIALKWQGHIRPPGIINLFGDRRAAI